MKDTRRFLYYAALCMVLLGCKHEQKTIRQIDEIETVNETTKREGIYAFPGEYEVDHPIDLEAYFDSLCRVGAFVAVHGNEKKDSFLVWDAIRSLNLFVQKKSKVFPAVQVRRALDALRLEQAYAYNHCCMEDSNGGEAFLFRLLEQAALHCYQIDYITDFLADDRKAGILYYEEWSLGNPLYSFLVYQSKQGFRVLTVGGKGYAKIEKIFHLTDELGREYYLCSNNNDGVYFCQYLYGWEGDHLKLLCEMDAEFGCPDCTEKGYELIFNPNQRTWSYCGKDGVLYHRVAGTPMLQLVLDGDRSQFVVLKGGTCKSMRLPAHERTSHLPIILLTAKRATIRASKDIRWGLTAI